MGRPTDAGIRCLAMECRGNEDRDLGAAQRRYPEGSLVRVVGGRHRGEYAVVECIDEAAFHELGEVIVWVDRGLGADYVPCSVMLYEIMLMQFRPGRQAPRSRSDGVRNRGVTRTSPTSWPSRSAAATTEPAASAPMSSSNR